jgi:hypothetical protein
MIVLENDVDAVDSPFNTRSSDKITDKSALEITIGLPYGHPSKIHGFAPAWCGIDAQYLYTSLD